MSTRLYIVQNFNSSLTVCFLNSSNFFQISFGQSEQCLCCSLLFIHRFEWRIREDVPTNLLAVKKASLEDGLAGVLALRASQEGGAVTRALAKVERGRTRRTDAARVALQDGRNRVKTIMERLPQQTNSNRRMKPVPVRVSAQWEDNETMAAYLNKK